MGEEDPFTCYGCGNRAIIFGWLRCERCGRPVCGICAEPAEDGHRCGGALLCGRAVDAVHRSFEKRHSHNLLRGK